MEERRLAAAWVTEFAAPLYGPGGGHVLVDHDTPLVVRGARALREAEPAHPAARPYVALANAVQAHAGDQATLAVLLAAAIVQAGDARPAWMLEALPWARRQVAATLAAHASPATPARALATVAPWADAVMDGLVAMGPHVDLSRIDIRAEDREAVAWSDAIIVDAEGPAPAAPGVLICDKLVRLHLAGATTRDPARHQAMESTARQRVRDHVRRLGIGLVLTQADDPLVDMLRGDGVLVATETPAAVLRRIEAATGARAVPTAKDAEPDDVGRASFAKRRRRRHWLVRGTGPSWTLLVPSAGPAKESSIDAAEKALRAAGVVLEDARVLPGGGQWQRLVAEALRRAADHAPGKAPLGIRGIADAFDGIADALVRNMGQDPWAVRTLGAVEDPAACVSMAVDAAFETATQVLRIDERITKRASNAQSLRGGTGPIGSPKGMPGDIPPLM